VPRPPRPSSSSSSSNTFTPQPGDWTCPACSDVNFSWRTECRSCQEPRPKAAAAAAAAAAKAFRSSSSSSDGQGRDKKVKKKKASSLVDKGVACCYGCGAPLQTQVPAAAGYVEPARFEAKKKHRQLQQVSRQGWVDGCVWRGGVLLPTCAGPQCAGGDTCVHVLSLLWSCR
jgi:hypothetical protein